MKIKVLALLAFVGISIAQAIIQFPVGKFLDAWWQQPQTAQAKNDLQPYENNLEPYRNDFQPYDSVYVSSYKNTYVPDYKNITEPK